MLKDGSISIECHALLTKYPTLFSTPLPALLTVSAGTVPIVLSSIIASNILVVERETTSYVSAGIPSSPEDLCSFSYLM